MKRVDSAYILAGGQSSRFGENKALVSVFGETQIVRLARQLASDGLQVTLVAQSQSDYQSIGIRLPIIEDGKPNSGPFAGVLAALRHSQQLANSWSIVCSCDLLEWRPEWRVAWDDALEGEPGWNAAVLTGDTEESDGFSPFPCLYRANLFDEAARIWESGVRSMRGFHSAIASQVHLCRVRHESLPKSFNTQAELANWIQKQH